MTQTLEKMFNALPDELICLIQNYARQPTPQERMARLYLHYAKMNALNQEPMYLIRYAEKHPSKFGYLTVLPKQKRAECLKKVFRQKGKHAGKFVVTCSTIPFAQLREKLCEHVSDAYYKFQLNITTSHLVKQIEQHKIYTLGKKMSLSKNESSYYRNTYVGKNLLLFQRHDLSWFIWPTHDSKYRKYLHQEAREFAIQYRG
jgi:hypothetical protein